MKANLLKMLGQKSVAMSIDPRCFPKLLHQPKPPAKIQAEINKQK